MAIIYLPGRSAFYVLLVLGTICLVDGIGKKDVKETLVGVGSLVFAIVNLVNHWKKKQADKNRPENNNSIKQ